MTELRVGSDIDGGALRRVLDCQSALKVGSGAKLVQIGSLFHPG